MTKTQKPRLGCAGFTLLELIVVLAILATATAMAMPAVERSRRALPVRFVTLDMAALMASARSEAVRSNREQLFTINLTARKYGTSAGLRERSLPRALTVAYEVPITEQPADGLATIRFRPDGSSSGGTITISAARQSAGLSVDWMTGAARIAWRR
jgi:general secretion pathway protein H